MTYENKYDGAFDFIRENNLKFSRQKMIVINELFFNKEDEDKKHFKINEILNSVNTNNKNIDMSSSSLLNILKSLCDNKLLKSIYVDKVFYDICPTTHFHFYDMQADELYDITEQEYLNYIQDHLKIPDKYKVHDINCIIKLDKISEN